MTAIDLKDTLIKLPDMLEFGYNGNYGHIDHYYIPETKSHEYLLYFDGKQKFELTVHSIDEVMKTPFVDGKTLEAVAEELDID